MANLRPLADGGKAGIKAGCCPNRVLHLLSIPSSFFSFLLYLSQNSGYATKAFGAHPTIYPELNICRWPRPGKKGILPIESFMSPTQDKARHRYQGAEGRQYHEGKRSIPEAAFPWIARFRAEKIAPWVHPSDTVLEYGVGLGWNLAGLRCQRRIGFDVGEFLEPAVRQRGIEFISDSTAQPPDSIDIVICHHTLEHAWHPPDVLQCILRLLRPGGRLLLFVPFEKENRFRSFRPDEPNHHLYSWNVQTLGNLVMDAGFDLQSAAVAPFGQERFAAVWAEKLGLGERGFRGIRWLANTLKKELEVRVNAIKPATR